MAFVTQSGVQSLKQQLADLRARNIKGKILVSTYLNFTCPTALKALKEFDNLEVRVNSSENVHAKGYYFNSSNEWQFIVGSSNWTANALSSNKELNILVRTNDEHTLTKELIDEFDLRFENSEPLSDDFLTRYIVEYDETRESQAQSPIKQPNTKHLRPNKMQLDAMGELAKLRSQGHQKALVISATGTGKTFLSAFDAKAFDSKKLLFVVHRENIARKALASFERVFGSSRSYTVFFLGTKKEANADFVFSTVQTLSRTKRLNTFSKDHFDYIIVDESHRAAASSYEVFLDYFRPKFLLGMTATPERTDGKDIFEKFDHNVGYEIRLQKALEEDILCPFHYFGVADIEVDGELLTDHADFNKLTSKERVGRVIEKAEFYGCQNNVIRGLIFCSRIEEAKELSALFNKRGYRTVALSGETSETDRELCIQRLESEDESVKLDYIFTVDIFNEGVDIPSVNQIIMLRPTQSAIIFVQQLGRGLRKLEDKEKFLTVIDFIGNYQNNYLIPIALFGDRSFDKDQIRRLMVGGNECIPGSSTISFDRIAKERIFNSINNAKTSLKRDLKLDYLSLKDRLGRDPMMMDFWNHGARDPKAFVDSERSLFNFKTYCDPDKNQTISEDQKLLLELYSVYVLNSVRAEESIILEQLITKSMVSLDGILEAYEIEIGSPTNDANVIHAIHCLNLAFVRVTGNLQEKTMRVAANGLLNIDGKKVILSDFLKKS